MCPANLPGSRLYDIAICTMTIVKEYAIIISPAGFYAIHSTTPSVTKSKSSQEC